MKIKQEEEMPISLVTEKSFALNERLLKLD